MIVFFIWLFGFRRIVLPCNEVCEFQKDGIGTVERGYSRCRIFGGISGNKESSLGLPPYLQIRKCACISSPMLIQLLKPAILLTDAQMAREDLLLVLRHEMIHLKRKDLLVQMGAASGSRHQLV